MGLKSRAGDAANLSVWTRSPSEFYIKFVLTQDTESELLELSKQFDGFGIILPERQLEYLKKLEYELSEKRPDPFRPMDLRHAPSQRFLHDQEIWSMWHKDRSTAEAMAAFSNRNVREHINSLIVTGFGPAQIVKLVTAGLSFPLTESSVEVYRHYFWKVEILTSIERETVFQSAKAGPIVASAHRAGASLIGKADVLHQLGHQVDEVPPHVTLKSIQREVMASVALTRDQPSSRRPKYLFDLAATMKMVNETEAMTQGESIADVFIKLSDHIANRRQPVSGVDSAALSTPGFRPKGLPGRRGDLEIIDADEVDHGAIDQPGEGTRKS
jgi:hypothetical protein